MAWLSIGSPVVPFFAVAKTFVFLSCNNAPHHSLRFFDLSRPTLSHLLAVIGNVFVFRHMFPPLRCDVRRGRHIELGCENSHPKNSLAVLRLFFAQLSNLIANLRRFLELLRGHGLVELLAENLHRALGAGGCGTLLLR